MANHTQGDANKSEWYILCELAGTTYGVPARLVQHMEMIDDITPVPNAARSIEGVVFSRGQVIPALNLRARFGFERAPHDLRTRLIITSVEGRVVGLIVDSAREFISITTEAIKPPGEGITGLSGKYLEGIATIGERIILILDLTAVIDMAEIIVPAPEGA